MSTTPRQPISPPIPISAVMVRTAPEKSSSSPLWSGWKSKERTRRVEKEFGGLGELQPLVARTVKRPRASFLPVAVA